MILDDMADFGWNPQEALDSGALTILSGTLKIVPTDS
jgi:hypothetical protein